MRRIDLTRRSRRREPEVSLSAEAVRIALPLLECVLISSKVISWFEATRDNRIER
jgi:hypothetical protein